MSSRNWSRTLSKKHYFILVAEAWGIIVRKSKHRYSLLLPVPRFLYYEIVPTHVPADKTHRGEVIRQQLCLTNSTLFLIAPAVMEQLNK